MALQFCQVVERIRPIQLACVDQAHEEIARARSIQRLIEQGIPAIQNRFLQGALDDVMPRAGLCRVDSFANFVRTF